MSGMAQVVKCKWSGENRGWCVTHDARWRIDRAKCEGHALTEKDQIIADIRSKLPILAVGYPDLAVEISHAMDQYAALAEQPE